MGDFLCFVETNFCDWKKNWFFLLEINFCDFHEVAFNWNYNILVFESTVEIQETTCRRKSRTLINGVPSDDPFL